MNLDKINISIIFLIPLLKIKFAVITFKPQFCVNTIKFYKLLNWWMTADKAEQSWNQIRAALEQDATIWTNKRNLLKNFRKNIWMMIERGMPPTRRRRQMWSAAAIAGSQTGFVFFFSWRRNQTKSKLGRAGVTSSLNSPSKSPWSPASSCCSSSPRCPRLRCHTRVLALPQSPSSILKRTQGKVSKILLGFCPKEISYINLIQWRAASGGAPLEGGVSLGRRGPRHSRMGKLHQRDHDHWMVLLGGHRKSTVRRCGAGQQPEVFFNLEFYKDTDSNIVLNTASILIFKNAL